MIWPNIIGIILKIILVVFYMVREFKKSTKEQIKHGINYVSLWKDKNKLIKL